MGEAYTAAPHDYRRDDGMIRIDVHAGDIPTPGQPPDFHLSRHDLRSEPEPDARLLTRFNAAITLSPPQGAEADRYRRGMESASVVAESTGGHEPPDLLVDRLMAKLVVVRAAGALIDTHTCRTGLRTTAPTWEENAGLLTTMTSPEPGAPVELFPALLYSWYSWWSHHTRQRARPGTRSPLRRERADDTIGHHASRLPRRRPAGAAVAPLPPLRLNLIENGRRFTVRLADVEPTTWPDLPTARHLDWPSDAGI